MDSLQPHFTKLQFMPSLPNLFPDFEVFRLLRSIVLCFLLSLKPENVNLLLSKMLLKKSQLLQCFNLMFTVFKIIFNRIQFKIEFFNRILAFLQL